MDIFGFFGSNAPTNINIDKEIRLYIHNDLHIVSSRDYSPTTTLNDYLRKTSFLTGTKVMCREGGCGCCVVNAVIKNPITNQEKTLSVNSCLVPVFSCHGWRIITVEGIGNSADGYHDIQKTLVKFNGTQCGFCSPGMVMAMYQLSQNPNLKMSDVENSLGGNICRCTGYRPILAAFKSLCTDFDEKLIGTIPDIEDLPSCPLKQDDSTCLYNFENKSFGLEFSDSKWYKVFSINEIFQIFKMYPQLTYKLVAGNTANGVYKNDPPVDLYIDVNNVKELVDYKVVDNKLVLGANLSLTATMELFNSQPDEKFSYLKLLHDHIDLVASVPVRNIGTIAGNISIKHAHPDFPSDIFLILETVGAKLTIVGQDKNETTIDVASYLKIDMNHKVIKNVTLPALDNTYKYTSYKIMPRAQNAHAIVNAGFLLKFNGDIVESARIVYGNINPSFVHATTLETFLTGKKLFENATLQTAYETLDKELVPEDAPPEPSPEFRKKLAIALFYKYVLSIAPKDKLSQKNATGSEVLKRPLSNGTQDYGTKESLYPVTKPITKLEAAAQVSGEAEYIIDKPDVPGQLFGALVLADAAPNSKIIKIDPSEALALDGVEVFFDKNKIPGKNSFIPAMFSVVEEIFCDGTVKYHSQPIGIIIANEQKLAEKAASLVKVEYAPGDKAPLFTIQEILDTKDDNVMKAKIFQETEMKRTSKGTDVKHQFKGKFVMGMQYHYHMETQCCNVIPIENNGLDVYPSTQGMDFVQSTISDALKIPANKINISVRRLGGAYGAKITRNSMIACQAALAAHSLRKPVKLWLPFETNMSVIGKRCPFLAEYDVSVDDKGVIQYMDTKIYSDYGAGGNEFMLGNVKSMFINCYKTDNYDMVGYNAKTDTHGNTYCRAPGTTEGLGLIESIMEHISYVTKEDPLNVRMRNFNDADEPKLKSFIESLKKTADIDNRKKDIKEFNKNNRWRKKGISVVPMSYDMELFGNWNILISVYQSDGTVALSHGGIEMGQGINTKVAQVCAYALKVPLESISVKSSNNLVSPNCFPTGGSLTSEAVCYAVLKAAEILKKLMEPAKQRLPDNASWLQIVQESYRSGIPLTAMYQFNPNEVKSYKIYGVCACEVEIDSLTGNYLINRVDLLEDTGDSMSPEIDIGQVEGAFVMGQGYWTTEQIVIGKKGEILNNRTWNYKTPGAKDIPIDFRVQFPKNNPNTVGILNSKATAEPPLCMTCVVPLAIRNAVASCRADANNKENVWYPIDGPSTVENIFMNCLHDYKQYVL